MESTKKQRAVSYIISPEPRPLRIKISKDLQNPFLEKSTQSISISDEKALMDLRTILEKQDSPLSKRTIQLGNRHRAPMRQKINPMIFDEKFIELNSSASTTEDSICLM